MPSKANITEKKTPEKAQTGDRKQYTKLTKLQCANLEQCAMMGLTITESCAVSNVSRRNFYHYCEKNPDFLQKIKMLQKNLIAHAKKNIAFTIFSEEGKAQAENSWRYLGHKRELSRLGLEGHDTDPDDGLDTDPDDIPKVATYQESITHLQKLLLPAGNTTKSK